MLHKLKSSFAVTRASYKGGEKKTLSRDCDGCTQLHICGERYKQVTKDGKVYCPDGTAHLVDQN
jgi:hypothetical protein